MKFSCSFLGFLVLSCVFLLFSGATGVSGGLVKETKPKMPAPSLEFLQEKVKESARLEMQRIASKEPKRLSKNDPRTGGMMDRVFEAIGMNSITWVPGLRSLMEMNGNGTQMQFVPLGRLLWQRFFGDTAANTLLGL